MKQTKNGGFSLIETVVAIAILGLITVPCTSGLLMSIRLNEKAQQMMQAQLAVSSAVETLMAEGIDQTIFAAACPSEGQTALYDMYNVTFDEDGMAHAALGEVDQYPGVKILITKEKNTGLCKVWVGDDGDNLAVDTYIRTVESQREVSEE